MDEARLRARLRKLDALASDRNPNTHERAAAKRKADELRSRIPTRRESVDPFIERLKQARRDQAASATVSREEQRNEIIQQLARSLQELKPGDQLAAGELCMNYYTMGGLDQRQWNVVNMYINELNERK